MKGTTGAKQTLCATGLGKNLHNHIAEFPHRNIQQHFIEGAEWGEGLDEKNHWMDFSDNQGVYLVTSDIE